MGRKSNNFLGIKTKILSNEKDSKVTHKGGREGRQVATR